MKFETVKLGDFVTITMGQSPKSEFYNTNGDGMPFLQGNRTFGLKYPNFDTYTTKVTKEAKAGDVIMSVRAPVGDLNITPINMCLGRGVCSLRANNNNQDFLFYLMKYYMPLLLNKESGTVFGSVNKNDINNLEINLPPLETQKKIASILSALDDKIELNNKINENLEMQAQAIFKSWFVDFENIERVTCHANEYFDISIGKTPPRKEHEWFSNNKFDNIKWVSISDMGNCGIYINDSSEYLTRKAIDKFNIKIVPKNTILLSFKLTIGRIAITNDIMATNEAIAHFKTKNQNIIEYLYCYLKNFNFQELGSTSSIATAVNSKIIKSMPFTIPTNKELANFHNVTNGMFNEIRKNQEENQRLAELRDTLLPKLMNGEIDVDDVQVKE